MTSVLLFIQWSFLGSKFDSMFRYLHYCLNALLVIYILPENTGPHYNFKIIEGGRAGAPPPPPQLPQW